MAVAALMLIAVPVGLVIVSFVGMAHAMSGDSSFQSGRTLPTLLCPVPGAVVTQGFGPTSVSLEPAGFGYPHFHTGLDLSAPFGTRVRAASSGMVEMAGTQVDSRGIPTGLGNYVKVASGDGFEEIYGHLQSISVTTNDIVATGASIGTVGSTGTSTGPHVHFELRFRSVPVDPAGSFAC